MPLSEGAAAFAALGAALYEQAAGFYADDARRVLQAHAERKQPPPESNARTAFKVLKPIYAVERCFASRRPAANRCPAWWSTSAAAQQLCTRTRQPALLTYDKTS